jgi:hypothetical protein
MAVALVERTTAAQLWRSAAQVTEQAQVAKHLFQRDLLAAEGKIDGRALCRRLTRRR